MSKPKNEASEHASTTHPRPFARLMTAMLCTGGLLLGPWSCGSSKSGDDLADAGDGGPVLDGGDLMPDADAEPDAGGDAAAETDPFVLWEELLEGVVASPADLESEAARLIEAGEWAPIIEFVRDRIATIPSAADGLGSPLTGPIHVLAGRRGVLRAGQGTLRDKAELLFEMLSEAGFEPERRFGNVTDDAAYWDAVLASPEVRFTPIWSSDLVTRGLEVLGGESPPALVDANGTEAIELAERIAGTLTELPPLAPFALSFSRIPLVEFEADGETRYGNVFDKTVDAGQSGAMNTPSAGQLPAAFPSAEITLSVVTSANPDVPVAVVQHSFPTDQLVGRQVAVQFLPAVDPEELLSLPLELVREFVPAISLRGHDMTQEQIDESSYTGDIVTLGGDILRLNEQGQPLFQDRIIRLEESADPEDVSSLELEVSAAGFPNIELRIAALDDSEQPVTGLGVSAFEVLEDGTSQSFSLLRNDPGAPRVLFLLDHSGSMPVEYGVDALSSLALGIAQDIQASRSTAEFAVKVIGGTVGTVQWTTDLDQLEQAASTAGGSASNLWRATGESSALAPTVVVCISDGQVSDASTPAYRANIAELGPVLFVDVTGSNTADVAEIVELTGGAIFAPTAADEIGPRAIEFIEAALRPSYILKYAAPTQGDEERTVTVRLRAAPEVEAEGSYRVDASAATATILRAELTLRIGSEVTTRVVAGDPDPPDEVTAAYVDRVRRELLAFNLIGFEVGDPTPHAVAKDLLRNKLAARPLVQALRDDDVDAARRALLEGAPTVPPALLAVLRMPQPAVADAFVYPTGIRAALYRHVSTATGIRESVDLLPFGPISARAPTPRARLEATLAAAARPALLEAAMFDVSTAALLEESDLHAFPPGTPLAEIYPELTDESLISSWSRAIEEHSDEWLVVPTAPDVVAFWSVDPRTGSMRGILADGSGGGATATQEQALIYLNMLDFAAGGVGVNWQLGFWISLSKAILKQAIRATKAISTLGVEPPPEGDIMDAVSDVACDMVKDKLYGALGNPGERLDFADSSVELFSGDGFPCTF